MENIGALVPFLIVCVVVVVIIFAIIASQRRKKELRAWAESKGLTFNASSNYQVDNQLPFRCLKHGHSRAAFNFINGVYKNHGLYVFDFRYKTGSGKNQQTHTLTVVTVDAHLPLKPLYIRREHFFDKMSEFVGFDDIDFEWKEFSDAFFVKATDKKWAYDVIHQEMMEYLMLVPKYEIEMGGPMVAVWNSRILAVDEIEITIDVMHGILNRFPDYLVKELKAEQS
ncbi:MAG: hypothetical protein P9L94_06585 [Candidatus Hinthialibacter antarcticus]|nr:hypothetical protein [Candidatus Hinthialibacter antarcticus]